MTENLTVSAPAAVPAGTYPATFDGLEKKTSREGVPFWVWKFGIATSDSRVEVSGASSEKTGPKSKAYKWLTALLGRRPEPGESLGDNLVGKACLLVVEQDEQGYNDVADVLPPAVTPRATVAPPAAVAIDPAAPPPPSGDNELNLAELPF